MADEVHHRFIERGNALVEEFAGASSLTAAAFGKAIDDRLTKLLRAIDQVPGNPYESAAVRSALDAFFAEVEALGVKLFGPGSVFEKQTMTVMGSMARNGLDRLHGEFRAQKFVLKQTLLDATAIRAAATDTYHLAARNLASVEPLRQLITQELIQGNGVPALKQALIQSGFLKDLTVGGRTYAVEKRAEMMARTEPRRLQEMTYQAATAKVEPEPEKRYYRWVSVLAPTSGEDSLVRHGHILTKPEWDSTRWPTDNWVGFPPLRPNDRCSVIFYREAWLSQENLKTIKGSDPTSEDRLALPAGQKAQLDALRAPKKPPAPKPAPPAAAAATPKPAAPAGPPAFNTVAEADAWIRQSGALQPDDQVAAKMWQGAERLDIKAMAPSGATQVAAFFDWLKTLKLPKVARLVADPKETALFGEASMGRGIKLGSGRLDATAAAQDSAKKAAKYATRQAEVQAHQAKYKAAVAQGEAEEAQVAAKVKAAAKGTPERVKLEEYLQAVRGDLKNARKVVEASELGARTARWSMSTSGPAIGDPVLNTLTHEYGHLLHSMMQKPDPVMAARFPGTPNTGRFYGYTRLGGKYAPGRAPTIDNLVGGSNAKNLNRDGVLKAAKVSEYATHSHTEHFAEAFTAYVRGHKSLLAPEVIQVVEEVLANAREMGLAEWGE